MSLRMGTEPQLKSAATSRKRVGYLCEINEATNKVKLFDCLNRKLISWEKPNGDVKLGKRYFLYYKKFCEQKNNPFGENVQFFVTMHRRQPQVRAITWATSPKVDEFPEDLRLKYQGRVWSDYFGFLDDPDRLFLSKFHPGQNGWICIQYDPSDQFEFRIIEARELNNEAKSIVKRPWDTDLDKDILTEDEEHDEKEMKEIEAVNTGRRVSSNTLCPNALCIRTNVKNHAYNPKHNGSKEYCNLFFNARNGLYRCLRDGQLGFWYKHEIRDDRNSKWFNPNTKSSTAWHSLFAPEAIKVPDPVLTRVNDDNKVEVTVDFVFNPDIFETPENRKIKDWDIRRLGIPREAHFWNTYLGVVEFAFNVSEFIIKTIEVHKLIHSKQPEVLNATPIVVTVVAVPREHHEFYAEEYPNRGLFVANRTKFIKYEGGGPVLFDYTKDN